jgi:hypothetical protein
VPICNIGSGNIFQPPSVGQLCADEETNNTPALSLRTTQSVGWTSAWHAERHAANTKAVLRQDFIMVGLAEFIAGWVCCKLLLLKSHENRISLRPSEFPRCLTSI